MTNNYSVEERNRIVEEHLWCVDSVVKHNRKAIRAAGAEAEDVAQDLSIRLIRAVWKYAPEFGDLRDFIFMELQEEVNVSLAPERVLGVTGVGFELDRRSFRSLENIRNEKYFAEESLAA